MTDSIDGFDRAPDRYMGRGRETIDRIRDRCRAKARALFGTAFTELARIGLGDEIFAIHCESTALKYYDRTGLKDDTNADIRKYDWYTMMAAHARSEDHDPRHERPGFQSYLEVRDD